MAETKKTLFSTTTGGTVKDSDIMAYKEDGASGDKTRNHLFSVMKTFFQGLLPARITQNETDITLLNNFVDPTLRTVELTDGRIAMQELTSGTLSVDGWYTVAELDNISSISAFGNFVFSFAGEQFIIDASIRNSGVAKTHQNSTIKIVAKTGLSTASTAVSSARLAKSDSVSNAGAKLQVNIAAASPVVLVTLMGNNSGRDTGSAWQLVPPVLENTPTLPDGLTAATFLEAGEELSFDNNSSTFYPSTVSARKATDDIMQIRVSLHEIVKIGSSVIITLPTTAMKFKNADGTISVTISGAHTISNFATYGNEYEFFINEVGAFSGLPNGSITFMEISGNNSKFTITG